MILECKQRLHVVNATFDMVLNAADDLEAYTEQMLTEVYDHDADGLVSSSELGDLDGGSFVTLDESLWLAKVDGLLQDARTQLARGRRSQINDVTEVAAMHRELGREFDEMHIEPAQLKRQRY